MTDMTISILIDALGWCVLFNILLYLVWVFLFIFKRDWMYHFHTRWFNLTPATFDRIHYSGIAFYKLLIIFFNLIPYLVLRSLI